MLFTCFTANPITNVLLYFMLSSAPGEGGEWCRFGRGGWVVGVTSGKFWWGMGFGLRTQPPLIPPGRLSQYSQG